MTSSRSNAACRGVRNAEWVFAGPGSPTFALEQWRNTPVPDALATKLRSGGAVVFSSAAALTLGVATVPVYEIYKVGVDPYWVEGLDVLSEIGLNVAVIPHYDNQEGGNHDTNFCYLGERRLAMLEPELPDGAFVLGIDEHTGVIMDLDADTAEIVGKGAVTLRRNGDRSASSPARTVAHRHPPRRPRHVDPVDPLHRFPRAGVRPRSDPWPKRKRQQDRSNWRRSAGAMRAPDDRLARRRHRVPRVGVLRQRSTPATPTRAVAAILELEAAIVEWSRDTLQSDDVDRARAALRSMIVRLGAAATEGVRDVREVLGPVVEAALAARVVARIREGVRRVRRHPRRTGQGRHRGARHAGRGRLAGCGVTDLAIRLIEVTKRFDGTSAPAVDSLSLDIDDGSIMALLGPSGCGKTTTLRMINRLIEPTSGRIEINGVDAMSHSPQELRRGIGYVIQQVGLFPHRTIARNIATVPEMLGWDKRRTAERVEELTTLVGLDHELLDRYPDELSGGQQQRVGVARALAADPPVLLMDEPFGAVDPIVRARLQDELLDLQTKVRKTIVLVTHDVDEALRLADRIALMNVGGVIEQLATPNELMRSPANEFVESFVGEDRGLRRLALNPVSSLPFHQGPVVDSTAGLDEIERVAGDRAERVGRRHPRRRVPRVGRRCRGARRRCRGFGTRRCAVVRPRRTGRADEHAARRDGTDHGVELVGGGHRRRRHVRWGGHTRGHPAESGGEHDPSDVRRRRSLRQPIRSSGGNGSSRSGTRSARRSSST